MEVYAKARALQSHNVRGLCFQNLARVPAEGEGMTFTRVFQLTAVCTLSCDLPVVEGGATLNWAPMTSLTTHTTVHVCSVGEDGEMRELRLL